MSNQIRRAFPFFLTLLLLFSAVLAEETLSVEILSPGEVFIQAGQDDTYIAYQVEGGVRPQTKVLTGTQTIISTLVPGKEYVFAKGMDEESALAALKGSDTVTVRTPETTAFILRNFEQAAFYPLSVQPGTTPNTKGNLPVPGMEVPEISTEKLAAEETYMLLSYEMQAGEPSQGLAVWTLESPLGDIATQMDSITFSQNANTESSGYLPLPYTALFNAIHDVHGTWPTGRYLSSLYISGMLAAQQELIVAEPEKAPISLSQVHDFTAELMGPGSLLLNWKNESGNQKHVVVYEKSEDPYYRYEEVDGTSLLLNWLIPGRTYRLCVGDSVKEVRSVIYDDSSRYITLTMPQEKPYTHRGFQATDAQVYRANNGSDWYKSTDKHIIDQDSVSAFKDIQDNQGDYYFVITYNFEETVNEQKDAMGVWVMQTPNGSEYFEKREIFLENYNVQGARYSININNVIKQYLQWDELVGGPYTFTLYLDGDVAARVTYDLP